MTVDTLIFDMDGVITTEEKYWTCARLTLWELVTQTLDLPDAFPDAVHDPAGQQAVASDDLIYTLKSRSVNSNWDICYLLTCLYLGALPGAASNGTTDIPLFLRAIRATRTAPTDWIQALSDFFVRTRGIEGRALVIEAGDQLQESLGFRDEEMLGIDGQLWWYLYHRFQRWYTGDATREHGAPPIPDGTVIPAEQLDAALRQLRETGYILGVATGRPMNELEDALGELGLLGYFDPRRMGTLDVARATEKALKVTGLTKPHPFSLLRAIYPEAEATSLLDPAFQQRPRSNVIMVGDSTSDPIMAKAAGCRCVGVLTGVRGDSARRDRGELLLKTGCEVVLKDVTELPAWLAAGHVDS